MLGLHCGPHQQVFLVTKLMKIKQKCFNNFYTLFTNFYKATLQNIHGFIG